MSDVSLLAKVGGWILTSCLLADASFLVVFLLLLPTFGCFFDIDVDPSGDSDPVEDNVCVCDGGGVCRAENPVTLLDFRFVEHMIPVSVTHPGVPQMRPDENLVGDLPDIDELVNNDGDGRGCDSFDFVQVILYSM